MIKTFDELSKKELYQIIMLRLACFIVEQETYYQDLDSLDFEAVHLFYYSGEEIVGYLRITDLSNSLYRFSRICVKEGFRGKGIATALINTSFKSIPEHSSIILTAQSDLTEFYQKFGFQISSSTKIVNGIDHIDMTRYS